MEQRDMERVISQFLPEGREAEYAPCGNGHINHTFLVTARGKERYILQRISERLTRDAKGLMENISMVTEHLRRKEEDPRKVLTLVPTLSGEAYTADPSGNWRMYRYVERSICLEKAESTGDFYESALAFGRFEELLKDFPVEKLKETLPDFHNTPFRCRQFRTALAEDRAGRKSFVEPEISRILENEERMGLLQRLRDEKALPVRVTHNDTKLSNVLFDQDTRRALCVIDLDTVMPGLSLYDFGDAIRYGACTAAEDEKDLSLVELDLSMYRAFQEGFLTACPDLTEKERELLPMGAWVITMEQAARFLKDYLDGDLYYHTSYPGQNLDRCRTQLKLAGEMERRWGEL